MPFQIEDLVGKKFGRLTAISLAKQGKYGRGLWACYCDCGNGKVVRSDYLKSGHTQSCGCLRKERMTGENNNRWSGGKYLNTDGYIMTMSKDHPGANKDGYVREHRLVMEGKLGRYLASWEILHHKDENKINNNPENLKLMTNSEHTSFHNKLRCGRQP